MADNDNDNDNDSAHHGLAAIAPEPVNIDDESVAYSDNSSAVHALVAARRYSAYALAGFVGLHAAAVVITPALAGLEAADGAIALGRAIYHAPAVESVLLAAATCHVAAGAGLRLVRPRARQRFQPRSRRLHFSAVAATGYALLPLLAGHVAITRLVPLAVDHDSAAVNLAYVARGFRSHRALSWVAYAGLVSLASFHVVYGGARWLTLPGLVAAHGGPGPAAGVDPSPGSVRACGHDGFAGRTRPGQPERDCQLAGAVVRLAGHGSRSLLSQGRLVAEAVFRWSALTAGVVYGAVHSYSLSAAKEQKHAADEWAKKEALIAQAKAEYRKLHPAPAASSSSAVDFSDPNFDLAKYLESAFA
ncbi:ATP synthase E chain-domain-containing protein [Lipomyces japonicus]|uniref:ATP synthase E chain-domain-containing protein n=1 Tax=Lipomyces japonicus TaxID=56871 RepID=UPI0034CD98E4